MLGLVLWQTLGYSHSSIRLQLAANENAMLKVVSGISRVALLTEEYADLQPYLENVLEDPHVTQILLVDATGSVVVSTKPAAVGETLPALNTDAQQPQYWRTLEISNAAGLLGTLAMEFSNQALLAAFAKSRRLGFSIAITGMILIAVIGIGIGVLLTRRLEIVTKAANLFAQGDQDVATGLHGKDEIGVLASAFDDMTRKVLINQNRLQQSKQQLQAILDNTPAVIYIKDLQGQFTFINQKFEELFGVNRNAIASKRAHDIFPKEYADKMQIDDQTVLHTEKSLHTEETLPIYNEPHTYVSVKFPLLNEQGKIYATCGISTDITQRVRIEKRLYDSQQRLLLHRKLTPLAIIEWDTDFKIIDWNPAAEDIFGFKKEEILNTQFFDKIFPSKSKEATERLQQTILSGNSGLHKVIENITRNGKSILCEWYNTPLVNEKHEVIGIAAMVEDITLRKQAEDELENHRNHLEELIAERTRELEATNKELASFSYSVSHDLRTPLRSMDGFSLALLEDYKEKLDEDGIDYLQRIRSGAQRMAALIDDMLKLSQTTQAPLVREAIDLTALARTELAYQMESMPQHQVKAHIGDGLVVNADQNLMALVLDNLLGNALKYSAKVPHPLIRLGSYEEDEKTVFYVQDNGAGFDMRYASKLFGTFQRLHKADEFPGTGIGLATVQRIIHRHGGKIWAKSAPDNGATFYFTLPDKV